MSRLRKLIVISIGIIVLITLGGVYYAGVNYRMLIQPKWHETINPATSSQNATIETDFNVLKSDNGIEYYGGSVFANYIAGEQDSGWDFALIFNYKDKNNYYKLMASADRNELALWKSTGGFLVVKDTPLSHFKWHKLSIDTQNNIIRTQLDDAVIFSYTDNLQEFSGGSFGTAHYGNALVISKNLKSSLLTDLIYKTSDEKHISNFHIADWRGSKWIFDEQEPIAKIDSSELVLYEAKLKKGYQPTGYWELFWKQYKGPQWYANKLISLNQLPSNSDKLILDIKSTTYDNAITSSVVMTVTFDNKTNSYEYDFDTAMTVNDGKTWDYSQDSRLEYLNFLAYNTVAPAAIMIQDAWQKKYNWILFSDKNNTWTRQPINHHQEEKIANTINSYDGKYIYAINDNVNPTIDLFNPKPNPSQLVELCAWAFDSHFAWTPKIDGSALQSGAHYTAHYKISTTEPVLAQKYFNQSILDPTYSNIQEIEVPIYRRTINDFRISRNVSEPFNEWTWSGNYKWVSDAGFDDLYSILLERSDDSQNSQKAYVDTAGKSYFTRFENFPAGKYLIHGYVKTEYSSGPKPTVSITSKHPEGSPNIYSIDISQTSSEWKEFSFETYLPKNSGINLTLSFDGIGKMWFDNVSWGIVRKDYLAPIYEFIEKVFGYVKRRI